MLSCFRPQQGVDPKVWATAIVGILLRYPIEVAREICNPFTGLAAKQQFMPSPYDVRTAAEELMRPLREKQYRKQATDKQLAEREEHYGREQIGNGCQFDPEPDPVTGKHPPGTILSNYDEAVRIYGRPIGWGEPNHSKFRSNPAEPQGRK